MFRKIVVFIGLLAVNAPSQGNLPGSAAGQNLNPPSDSMPLQTQASVGKQVSVQAVLLPPSTTRGLFGRSVSDRYAVVQVVISNHSQESSMVLQSIFIDYSRWLLSGMGSKTQNTGEEGRNESANTNAQVASAEYRVPRGQLLDAQPWTARNITLRSLEAAGSLASGYGFAFSELGIAKGIASYNGNFLPAARYLWPDRTIDQLNRISDLGFRVNTIVPAKASVIMVAFFPLDRFLTPGLKKIYMKSPAIFFVPTAAFFDSKVKRDLERVLNAADKELMPAIKKQIKDDLDRKKYEGNDFLNKLSLNQVRVLVEGTMTVDQDVVAPAIEEISFEGETAAKDFWNKIGKKRGVIRGRFLIGGKVIMTNAEGLAITNVTTLNEGATENSLPFTLELTKPVAAHAILHFRIDKKTKDGEITKGNEFFFSATEKMP